LNGIQVREVDVGMKIGKQFALFIRIMMGVCEAPDFLESFAPFACYIACNNLPNLLNNNRLLICLPFRNVGSKGVLERLRQKVELD